MENFFRLKGTTVTEFTWAAPAENDTAIGDLMVVVDERKEIRFFCRVHNITHNNNEIEITAYPIGFAGKDNIFRRPRIIPTINSPVRATSSEDIEIIARFMGDLEVGQMMSGLTPIPDLPVKLPSSIIRQHVGVFATTGMGKSNFMKVFCGSVISTQPFGLLITDPHGEYATGLVTDKSSRGLLNHSNAKEGLVVYSIQNESIRQKLGMKPLIFNYDDISISDLSLLFDHSRAEAEVINLLEPFSGKDIFDFFIKEDVESLPNSFRITSYIGDHQDIASRIRSGEPAALRIIQREVQTLMDIGKEFIFEEHSSIQDIINNLLQRKVVLIDIPGRSEVAELFILATISRAIMRYFKGITLLRTDNQKSYEVQIAIEEAQRVLSIKAEKTGIFREIAMEGRKFGVGICAITQQPKNIDPKILAQMNTFIVMGLADQQDREIIMSSAKQNLRVMQTEIQTLDRGDAIISTIGIPFPVSCHIHRYEDVI